MKVTFFASTQRGMRSTSSCSTWTHSTGPMPPGKSNTSGSLNGGRVKKPASTSYPPSAPTARSRSHTTGGLRHSSMIVHIENAGGEDLVAVVVADDEVGAVAGAELVDLG